MPEIKLVINDPKTKRSTQKVLDEAKSKGLFNLKIGDTLEGSKVDLQGYEFQITGGSDKSGTPMRKDVDGKQKRKILIVKGIGHKKTRAGVRRRKTIAGNTIGDSTAQVNIKITKYGKEKIEGLEEKKPEQKNEDTEPKKQE